mmetsp:Transcript_32690/g.23623  ORF Transcript_32690/g.23623 Transcript_32690/m.23623 type:complete len:203 (-) Transcript_32690:62-670(-)
MPVHIQGLSYYDFIGNISTSHAIRLEDDHRVSFEIQPRFPVCGQWKTDWHQGYNSPTKYHLYTKQDNTYVFDYSFMHAYDVLLVEDYTLEIVLPLGATDIQVNLPFDVDEQYYEEYFSTLDFFGRTKIVIKKENVFSEMHSENFQITYKFDPIMLLSKPLLCSLTFLSFYLISIFLSRIDVSLDKKVQKKHSQEAEDKQKVE